MSRPWMPLYIADYLADTMHFSAAEHGAYLLLIMHYWANGELPDDDARLARIVRMSDAEWAAARAVIRPKFGEGWTHTRIDGELAEAERLAAAGKKGGEASAESRRNKRNPRPKSEQPDDDVNDTPSKRATIGQRSAKQTGNDRATISQAPQSHPPDDDQDDARAREPLISEAAMRLADEIAVIAGYDLKFLPPGWCGAPYRVETWCKNGWKHELCIASAREQIARKRDGPPSSIQYFEKGIAAAHAQASAPLPEVKTIPAQTVEVTNAKTGNVIAAADRLVERVRQFDQPAPAESDLRLGTGAHAVRTISQG